jgi:hypothetical protein
MEAEKLEKLNIISQDLFKNQNLPEPENPYLQSDPVEQDVHNISVVLDKIKQKAIEFGQNLEEQSCLRSEIEYRTNATYHNMDKNMINIETID